MFSRPVGFNFKSKSLLKLYFHGSLFFMNAPAVFQDARICLVGADISPLLEGVVGLAMALRRLQSPGD